MASIPARRTVCCSAATNPHWRISIARSTRHSAPGSMVGPGWAADSSQGACFNCFEPSRLNNCTTRGDDHDTAFPISRFAYHRTAGLLSRRTSNPPTATVHPMSCAIQSNGDIYVVEGMKQTIPMGLVAAAGVELQQHPHRRCVLRTCIAAGGIRPPVLPIRTRTASARKSSINRRHGLQPPRPRLQEGLLRRLQSLAPAVHGTCPDRLIGIGQTGSAPSRRRRRSRTHQGHGIQGRHDAGQSRRTRHDNLPMMPFGRPPSLSTFRCRGTS